MPPLPCCHNTQQKYGCNSIWRGCCHCIFRILASLTHLYSLHRRHLCKLSCSTCYCCRCCFCRCCTCRCYFCRPVKDVIQHTALTALAACLCTGGRCSCPLPVATITVAVALLLVEHFLPCGKLRFLSGLSRLALYRQLPIRASYLHAIKTVRQWELSIL